MGLRWLLLAAVLAALPAWPAGAVEKVTRYYELERLGDQPGEVVVTTDYLTVLEFDREVSRIASARGDLLNVEANGSQVLVRAAQRSGSTDLVAVVGSQTALFRVEIDAEATGPRRYVIRSAARPVRSPAPPTASAPLVPGSASPASPGVPEWEGVEAEALPPGVTMRVLPIRRRDALVLLYEVVNQGRHAVTLAQESFRMRAGDREWGPNELRVRRTGTGRLGGLVDAGTAEYGVIVLPEAIQGLLTLQLVMEDLTRWQRYPVAWTGPADPPATPAAGQ